MRLHDCSVSTYVRANGKSGFGREGGQLSISGDHEDDFVLIARGDGVAFEVHLLALRRALTRFEAARAAARGAK